MTDIGCGHAAVSGLARAFRFADTHAFAGALWASVAVTCDGGVTAM
jgi:hypothetical protein